MKSQSQKDVYQIITDLFIDKLEQGTIPWQQSWSMYGPAVNLLTRKPKALSWYQPADTTQPASSAILPDL